MGGLAWALLVALPVGYVVGLRAVMVGMLPLVALGLGIAAISERTAWARAILLAIYPSTLGLVLVLHPELVARDTYGPIGIGLGSMALLAYAAAAAHAVSRVRRVLEHSQLPATTKDPVVEPRARRWFRRFLLLAAALGAIAIAIVAPAIGAHSELVHAWGEAADDAAVLTSVAASLVAAIAIGALIGPALRAERVSETVPKKERRFAIALTVSAIAAALWLLLTYLDRTS
jgi:hypothetical protein